MHRSVFRRVRILGASSALVAGAILTIVGCEAAHRPRPALELDVAQYIARIKQWAPAESEVSAAIARIFRSHFVDVDLALSITSRTLPSIEAQVAAIAAYTPQSAEVAQIHTRYARAWRRVREGFKLIDQGMKTDDAMQLASGRGRLEVWQEEMQGIAAALRQLVDDVGLSETKTARRRHQPGAGHRPQETRFVPA